MTVLTRAIRDTLAQDSELTALLGKSASWPTWIFDDSPLGVQIENTSRCLIVVTESDTWTTMNMYNTQTFPRVFIDVWADPDRHPDHTTAIYNAKDKVERIISQVDKTLHLVNRSDVFGMPIVFGTEEQIANRTGVRITDSSRWGGISFSPLKEDTNACMGRVQYNLAVG